MFAPFISGGHGLINRVLDQWSNHGSSFLISLQKHILWYSFEASQ